jgi:hypothetical protein
MKTLLEVRKWYYIQKEDMFLVYATIMLKMDLTIFSIISISEYEGYDLYYSGSSQGIRFISCYTYVSERCLIKS